MRAQPGTRVLLLEAAEQSFVFEDVPAPPVPSLLRGFSAPVRLRGVPRDRLRFLAVHDTDPFVRWEIRAAIRRPRVLLDMVAAQQRGEPLGFDDALAEAVRTTLAGAEADPAFAAEALALPGEGFLADQMAVADPAAIHAVRAAPARARSAGAAAPALRATYDALADAGPYRIDGRSIGRRALRNTCLAYLAAAGDEGIALAKAQFDAATNMTDSLAALSLLADTDGPARDAGAGRLPRALARRRPGAGQVVLHPGHGGARRMRSRRCARCTAHPDFDLRNPNRARALIGAFASGNPAHFHDAVGRGLPLPRRCGDRARPDQRARSRRGWSRRSGSGGGSRAARGSADAAGTAAGPGHAEPLQGHLREGVEGAALDIELSTTFKLTVPVSLNVL